MGSVADEEYLANGDLDLELRRLSAEGVSCYAAHRSLGLTYRAVRRRWEFLQLPLKGTSAPQYPKLPYRRVREHQWRRVLLLLATGNTQAQAAKRVGVCTHTVVRKLRAAPCSAPGICVLEDPSAGGAKSICPMCHAVFHQKCYVAHGFTAHCELCEGGRRR